MIVTSFLVGLGVTLAQPSQVRELVARDNPVIYFYALGDFAPIDESILRCPTIASFCIIDNGFVVDNMQEIAWYRNGVPCGNESLFEHQEISETTVVSMEMVDFYGNTYTDSKTIQIRPPAPPLDAYAELAQNTINGQEGYFVSIFWDNSEPRAYDGLALFRNGVGVGGAAYEEGFFIDPTPIDPLNPPGYVLEVRDACDYPSFSQIFETMYLSQHEDIGMGGYWLVLDVGLVNRGNNETRTIHILNENNEDLIQVPLVAAHDSIFVTSDWMSQFSSIRAGLSIESEGKDGNIVSYSNWIDSPSYDGISENVSAVVVYPNPTTGIVNVQSEGLKNVAVFDCLGRTLQTLSLQEDRIQLDLLPFGEGVYYLRIETVSAVEVRKIVLVR